MKAATMDGRQQKHQQPALAKVATINQSHKKHPQQPELNRSSEGHVGHSVVSCDSKCDSNILAIKKLVSDNGGNNKPGVTEADKSGNNQLTVSQETTTIVAWPPADVVLQLDSDWPPTRLADYGTHGGTPEQLQQLMVWAVVLLRNYCCCC